MDVHFETIVIFHHSRDLRESTIAELKILEETMKFGYSIKILSLFFLGLILILTACGAPADQFGVSNPTKANPEPTATAPVTSGPLPTESSSEGIPTNVLSDTPMETAEFSPTQEPPTPEPTATILIPEPLPLELIDQGFVSGVNYAFLVHNPNPVHAVQNSTFTATFYDANGDTLGTDSLGAIELVLPGQTMGVSDGYYLDDPSVTSMSITLNSGEPVLMTDVLPAFEVINMSECNHSIGGIGLRAEIVNPYASNVVLPRVSVIYYDASGKIVGSGTGYRAGLASNAKTGVLIWGYHTPEMDHFEVYPGYRGLPSLVDTLPEGALPIKIVSSGYAVKGSTVVYGVVIENPNQSYMVDRSILAVNAYSADGKLLSGDPWLVINLLPGQVLGISQELDLCDGDVVDHIEVSLGSGDYTESQSTTFFTSENVSLQSGSVTGELVNSSGMELKVIYATAVVYDANDKIIGGGTKVIDACAAGERVQVQIPVTINGEAARVEMYAVLTYKSLPE